ncbi:hypothetical protein DPMN_014601 [Dreissena polymorpha]|uniref:Uncharacterized protein n=1 Tax=Dreissena polymorpha TaxID=45954 RepID=A0A9D4NC14_DREPO|nr:hypothetical protein DPMN_014601 [Dreissena polymorpha]
MVRNDTPCKRQDPGTDTLTEVLPLGLIWTSDVEDWKHPHLVDFIDRKEAYFHPNLSKTSPHHHLQGPSAQTSDHYDEDIASSFSRKDILIVQDEFAILVPFSLSFKKLIKDAHRDYYASISIGGRPISNEEFADDIDLMDGTSSKPQDHTN